MEVKVTLDEKMQKKFEAIKEACGLQSNTETVRFCINKEYKRLVESRDIEEKNK